MRTNFQRNNAAGSGVIPVQETNENTSVFFVPYKHYFTGSSALISTARPHIS